MRNHFPPSSVRSMQGMSIIELMIGITLGLLVLAGLASIFASSSANRAEMERVSRQIENGRFAMELLSDDLRVAGFYGELSMAGATPPAGLPDPCELNPALWHRGLPLAVQGYDRAMSPPLCVPADVKGDTDILVVRLANTCEPGNPIYTSCEPVQGGKPYIQVSKCSNSSPPENLQTQPGATLPGYLLGLQGATNFTLRARDCGAATFVRRFYTRIYYVSVNNGRGEPIPTLKRLDLDGTYWTQTPLVEGIEELNIEYGIDWDGDGSPDGYNTDPTNFTGCTGGWACAPATNWFNVVTARVNLLARNTEASPGYTDTKRYSLGRDDAGNEIVVAPGGPYRRHVYASAVRLVNVGQRREKPP